MDHGLSGYRLNSQRKAGRKIVYEELSALHAQCLSVADFDIVARCGDSAPDITPLQRPEHSAAADDPLLESSSTVVPSVKLSSRR